MRWLFGDGSPASLAYADAVLTAMTHSAALVPSIWHLEVANVIARAETRALVATARTAAFLDSLRALDIRTDADTQHHAFGETLSLARRHGLSAYDAAYLELSMRSSTPLATLDTALQEAAAKAGASLFSPG